MKKSRRVFVIILSLLLVSAVAVFSSQAENTVTYEVGEGKEYATVQAAVADVYALETPAEPTVYTINVFAGEYAPVKIIQQENKSIIIQGESREDVILNAAPVDCYSYRSGAFTAKTVVCALAVDGGGRIRVTEAVTVRNLTLKQAESGYTVYLTQLDNSWQHYSYSHNITVEDCKFIDLSGQYTAVAMGNENGGTNIAFKRNEFHNMHSIMQVNSIDQINIEDCTLINCARGMCTNSSTNVTVKNTDFGICTKYVIRVGQSSGAELPAETSIVIDNCSGSTTTTEADEGFLVIRKSVPKEIVIENSAVGGKIICTNNNAAELASVTVELSDNYWGVEAPVFEELIVGFEAAPVPVIPEAFFLDAQKQRLSTDCDVVGYHTYGEWYFTTEPTCYTDGVKRRECINERCTDENAFETAVAPATEAHVYTSEYTLVTAPTCQSQGEERAYCTTPGCTAYQSRATAIAPDAHRLGEWELYETETCSHDGSDRQCCLVPGCTYYNERPRAMTNIHIYDVVVSVIAEPTCHSDGRAEYKCRECDLTQEGIYGEATGLHIWSDWTVTKDATVSENGIQERSCLNPGCTAHETVEIEATGFVGLMNRLIAFIDRLSDMFKSLFALLEDL